jgi:hypothetical protein
MIQIQAVTISGEIIENGRWEIQSPTAQLLVNQEISVCLNSDDDNLVNHVKKFPKNDCYIEQTENEKTQVIVAFSVIKIKHMVDNSKLNTLYVITPINRHNESVTLYILSKEKCDRRFIELLNK